jgi:inner membrane protein
MTYRTEGALPPSAVRSPGPGVRFLAGILAVATIAALDACIWRASVPRWALGIGDESAHLLTAALALSAWYAIRRTRPPRELIGSALIFAVLIDADHVPGEIFHNDVLTRGTYRPYGHTLLVIAIILIIAALAPTGRARNVVRGSAIGVALHLIRDLPTGGVPLFWPVVDWTVRYPYPAYASILLGATAAPILTTLRRRTAHRDASLTNDGRARARIASSPANDAGA